MHIRVDPAYAGTYAGQVAAITAASLISRMSKTVAVEVPSQQVLKPLPWATLMLDELIIQTLKDAHQYGIYEQRSARQEDLRLVVGRDGDGLVIHGCGWGAYCGTEPSPIAESDEPNPFGAAFAAILAASLLQASTDTNAFEPISVDTYRWRTGLPSADAPKIVPDFKLGELWCIGVGSVGSCVLFFLSLVTCAFHAVLVDRDTVKVENVTRSALFSWRDALANTCKVDVATRWLNEAGVDGIERNVAWLDEIPERWRRRAIGSPDILISAANERNVRSEIEAAFPPLQVYATTGRNWQAMLYRHIPLVDGCSLCVPGSETPQVPVACATRSPTPADNSNGEDDVALPFLSYAAGLMTAAEISKLALTGETVTRNRVYFNPRQEGLLRAVELSRKSGCFCQRRDETTHMEAIQGSRFASFSAA